MHVAYSKLLLHKNMTHNDFDLNNDILEPLKHFLGEIDNYY